MIKKHYFFLLLVFLIISCQTLETKNDNISIFGTWTRINILEKTYKEILILRKNYTYKIEAREIETNVLAASNHGTFSFNNSILTMTDKDNEVTNEPCYLIENGNKLIINNKTKKPWIRIK